ncbi:MAG: CBU_0592 family membrane protein [Sphingopyxis terrae]|uniref:CBU_0592 family membrane protein n=1 Tax=Sphingopyxis terrae TaxID=33052 RepID=UPI003F7FCB16
MNLLQIMIEVIGWTAAAIILASYVLLSLGKLEPRGAAYQWMNVVGATGFVINSGYNGALPSAGLNIIWAAIGLFALWNVRRLSRADRC